MAALPLHAGALRTWCGPSGEQDWSASTNWVDGLVAMTNDTAYFPHNNAYHANGTGKRRYWFKVAPPEGFTGTVLTTNELWSNDSVNASYKNVSFCPTVELTVSDNAAWNVDGNGTVVASDGIASRLSGSFAGTVEVRKGTTFVPSPSLNPAVRFTGAGTLALSSGSRFAQVEAFAGSIECSSEGMGDSATVLALKGSSITLADGQTLSFDSGSLMYSPVLEMESFVDDPGKWTFNGTAWAEGNLASGPFNPDPPYVRDGELWLTDDPAQIHTVWYTNRTFRLTDDWGMSFRYNPELPAGTRITTEVRADGKTRNQEISGYFGILFSRSSPTNVGANTSSGIQLAHDSRGFLIDLYRGDPCAKVMWLAEGDKYNYRSVHESETGIKLNAAMDIAVSVIGGVMTVTMVQNGKSVSYSHDYSSAINERAAEGFHIGLGGSTSWWGDDHNVPWVRHRISGFRAWYRSETDGPGWVDLDNAEEFDIRDPSKWSHRKVVRTSETTAETNNAALFAADGVRLTDAAPSNCAFVISKANPPKRSNPLLVSCRFKTSDPVWTATEYGQITFLFGTNSDSTRNNATSWSAPAYGNTFGGWTGGLDWIWNANNGDANLHEAYHTGGTRREVAKSASLGKMGSTYAAAMASPEKHLRTDIVWNPNGTLKAFVSVSTQDRTGSGRCGSVTYTGLADKNYYANFTNRTDWCIGVKAVCRNKAYAAITMTEFSVKRLAAAVGGETGRINVPAGAAVSIKAGDMVEGQTLPVMGVHGLELGAGSSMTVRPESGSTKVGIASVSSAGATLSAAEGTEVTLGGRLSLTSAPEDAGLVLSGDVSLGGNLSISIPSSWKAYRYAPIVVIDASETAEGLPSDCTGVSVSDEDGVVDSRKYVLSVRDGKLLLDFRKGLSVVVR